MLHSHRLNRAVLAAGLGFFVDAFDLFLFQIYHVGTNLRVLVTATVTNFMRGSVTLLIPFHLWLEHRLHLGLAGGSIITGCLVWSLALFSVLRLPETYAVELDRVE